MSALRSVAFVSSSVLSWGCVSECRGIATVTLALFTLHSLIFYSIVCFNSLLVLQCLLETTQKNARRHQGSPRKNIGCNKHG